MKKFLLFLQISFLAASLYAADFPGLKTFQKAAEFHGKKTNFVLSPYSLRQCGAILYHGTSGNVAKELQKALELPQNCGDIFHKLHKEFAGEKNIRLFDFNAVFSLYPLLEEYLNTISKHYAVRHFSIAPGNVADTAQKVNVLTAKQSAGMLQNCINANDLQNSDFIAMSTLLLNADWETPFPFPAKPAPFTLADGRQKNCQMMYNSLFVQYFSDRQKDIHGIVLPFKNRSIQFIAAKSLSGKTSTTDLLKNLDKNMIDNAGMFKTDIALPKMDIQQRHDVSEFLKHLGARQIFAAGGGLDKISFVKLVLSKVIQNVRLTVDERSTKAAAATVAVAKRTALVPPSHIRRFYADSPFFILIRHKKSGEILFAACINTP